MLNSSFSYFNGIFWWVFGCTPPPHPRIHWNPCFCYVKGIPLVHIWAKFHLCLICSSPVFKFQMFSAEGTILGCFWVVFGCNPLKCGQIFWNFDQWCNVTSCIRHVMDKAPEKRKVFVAMQNPWNPPFFWGGGGSV